MEGRSPWLQKPLNHGPILGSDPQLVPSQKHQLALSKYRGGLPPKMDGENIMEKPMKMDGL